MPAKSLAQLRFINSDKSGFTQAQKDEWNEASKGLKLPEHVKSSKSSSKSKSKSKPEGRHNQIKSIWGRP